MAQNCSDSSGGLFKQEALKSPTKSKELENAANRSPSKLRLEAIVESENETEYLFTCQSDISKLDKAILDRVTIKNSDLTSANDPEQFLKVNITKKEEVVQKLERQLAKVQKEVVRLKKSTSLLKKREDQRKEQEENQSEQLSKSNSKNIRSRDVHNSKDDGKEETNGKEAEKIQNTNILLPLDENILSEKQLSWKKRQLQRSPAHQHSLQGSQLHAIFGDLNTTQAEGKRELDSAQSLDSNRMKNINMMSDQRRRRSQQISKMQDDSLSLCLPPICIPSRSSSQRYPGSLSARSNRICFDDLQNEEEQQQKNLLKMVGSIERTRWQLKQQQQQQPLIQFQPQQSQVKLHNRYSIISRESAEKILRKEEEEKEESQQSFENKHHNPFIFEQPRTFRRSNIADNLKYPLEKKQLSEIIHHLPEKSNEKLIYLKNCKENRTATTSNNLRELPNLSSFEPAFVDNDMSNYYYIKTQNQTKNQKIKEQCQSHEQHEWEKITEKMILEEFQYLKMPTKTPRRKKQSANKETHKISIKDLKPLLFPSYASPLSSLDSKQASTSLSSSMSSQYFINSRLSLSPNSLKKI